MSVETEETPERMALAQDLSSAGYDDVLVLKRDTAKEVLSEKRMELVDTIRKGDAKSIRGLARRVGRDVGAVHRDLQILYQHEIVQFREEDGGKIPEIAHENVIVEPLV